MVGDVTGGTVEGAGQVEGCGPFQFAALTESDQTLGRGLVSHYYNWKPGAYTGAYVNVACIN